jgi:hypothetical protein
VPSALIQSLNPLIGDFINTIGQNAKTSQWAYIGRFAPNSRHCSARLARQNGAASGLVHRSNDVHGLQ